MSLLAEQEGGIKNTAAKLRFLVTQLPKTHQENFQSCLTDTDLLDAVANLNAFRYRGTHVRRLDRFINNVKPFFAAMDVLSQVDPIHLATVWGAIRVIIQLAENYTTFFGKFAQSLDDLAREMDFFSNAEESIASINPSEKQRMAAVLEDAFEDILLYLTGVMRIFFKSDGTAKSRARVFSKAVWNPFRFDQIVESMKGHRSALRDEALLYNLSTKTKAMRAQTQHQHETEHRETTRRIQAWLAPPNFTDRYDEAINLRLPETGEWIFDHQIYSSWFDQSIHPELVEVDLASSIWIYGKPGSGKTVLAAAVTERLKTDYPDDVCYFFFNSLRHQANDSSAAFRSILAQILQKRKDDERLLELFSFAMYFGSDGQLTASHREVDELVDLCFQLPSIRRLFLVLDGLDECEPHDFESKVIPKLRKFCSLTHINLVLFGRETIKASLEELEGLRHLHVGSLNFQDIKRLSHEGLVSLLHKRRLPPDMDLEESASRLARRADGMFLWARLMISYLNCRSLAISERVTAILEVDSPEGLEKMYERIFDVIARGGKPVLQLASRVFLWLSHGIRHVTAKELEEAVIPDRSNNAVHPTANMEDFSDTVIWTCGGFVEKVCYDGHSEAPDDVRFRFIHASVKEYFNRISTEGILQSDAFQGVELILRTVPANIYLATQCLEYITYKVPAQPLSATFGSNRCGPNLQFTFPLSNYAAQHWSTHLLRTEETFPTTKDLKFSKDDYSRLISTLQAFLNQPNVLTAWIEISYLFDKPPTFQTLLDWVSKVLKGRSLWIEVEPEVINLAKRVEAFASQLRSIVSGWNSHLTEDPGCAWQEVIAYSNSDFLARNPSITVNQLVSEIPVGMKLASKHVNRISKLISGGVHDMVLSIYPTREFFDCYDEPRLHSLLFKHLDYSTGWVARLEIFEVLNSVKIMTKDIPLEPVEVLLHLYQTLLGGSVQFPLAISPNGRHVTVLRTLYSFVSSNSPQGGLNYLSSILQLPENNINKGFWSLPKKDATGYIIENHVRMRRQDMEKIFHYWIFFNQQSRELCVTEHTWGLPHSFSIFQLSPVTSRSLTLEPTLIAQKHCQLQHPYLQLASKKLSRSQVSKDFELVFHPFHPAVAIAGETGSYIWNYSVGFNNKPIRIDSGRALSYSQTWRTEIAQQFSYDIFAFSADGEFLITKTSTSLPDVRNITSYLLQKKDHDEDSDKDRGPKTDLDEKNITALLSYSTGKSITGSERVLTNNGVITIGDRASGVLTSNSGRAVSIVPLATNPSFPSREAAFTLTRLPTWNGSPEANASIIASRKQDEAIKIVLDQTARTRNSLGQSGNTYEDFSGNLSLPLVIEPSVASLAQINQLSIVSSSQAAPLEDKNNTLSEEDM